MDVRATWFTILVCQFYLKDFGERLLMSKIKHRVKYNICTNLKVRNLPFRNILPFMKVALRLPVFGEKKIWEFENTALGMSNS